MKLTEINYNISKPKEIELKNPATGQSFEKKAFISVYSIESEVGSEVKLNMYRDMLVAREGDKTKELSNEDIKVISQQHIYRLIAGWKGIDDKNGKPLKYSEANAKMLVKDYDIIFNFLNIESYNLGNFIRE